MNRAVFLDRDGVLVRSAVRDGRPYAPTSLEEFELLPDAVESVRLLRKAGFCTIVVTNQPDVSTGKLESAVLEQMHRRLREWLELDDIKVCPHLDAHNCVCRKPKPGLLLQAAAERRIDLQRSFMVGDRWRDVSAGRSAGCRSVFIDCGYGEPLRDRPDFVVTSLREAARIIVAVPDTRGTSNG